MHQPMQPASPRSPLTWEDLRRGAAALDGASLTTLGRGALFTVRLAGDAVEFLPRSSGKPRRHCEPTATRVLAAYNREHTFSVGRYKRITAHASYVLALIATITGEHPRPAT